MSPVSRQVQVQKTDLYKIEFTYMQTLSDLHKMVKDMPDLWPIFKAAKVGQIPGMERVMPDVVLAGSYADKNIKAISREEMSAEVSASWSIHGGRFYQVLLQMQHTPGGPNVHDFFSEAVVNFGGRICMLLQEVLEQLIKGKVCASDGYYTVSFDELRGALDARFGSESAVIVVHQAEGVNLLHGAFLYVDYTLDVKQRPLVFRDGWTVKGVHCNVTNPNVVSFRFPIPSNGVKHTKLAAGSSGLNESMTDDDEKIKKLKEDLVKTLCTSLLIDSDKYLQDYMDQYLVDSPSDLLTTCKNIMKAPEADYSMWLCIKDEELECWVKFAEGLLGEAVSAFEDLKKFDMDRRKKTVIAGCAKLPSIADLIAFVAIHPLVDGLADSDKEKLPGVKDWMNFIQAFRCIAIAKQSYRLEEFSKRF